MKRPNLFCPGQVLRAKKSRKGRVRQLGKVGQSSRGIERDSRGKSKALGIVTNAVCRVELQTPDKRPGGGERVERREDAEPILPPFMCERVAGDETQQAVETFGGDMAGTTGDG